MLQNSKGLYGTNSVNLAICSISYKNQYNLDVIELADS